MPVDPNVKLMLDAMAAANMNPFEDNILAKSVTELRGVPVDAHVMLPSTGMNPAKLILLSSLITNCIS